MMVVFAARVSGQELFWNANGTGGDGIWGSTPGDKNWNLMPGAPAGTNTFWLDGPDDVAVFQDALGGTVTVFDEVRTHGITQQGADYRIEAGTIVMTRNTGGDTPFVNVAGGVLAVDAPLSGTDGLVKTGAGSLLLSAANSYTGGTAIQGGTLDLSGSLASTSISIASGASLLNQNGGLSNSATLTNAGSLTLNANDTISSYISNGGTLTNGPGTLFATSAALNDGSTVAGLLNATTLTTGGVVNISGTATAGSTTIQSGTLTLGGSLISDTVGIASGATLLNQNGGLSNSATLTNAGSLTLGANDTITSYLSNGGTLTNGPGTLSAISAALNDGSTVAGQLNAVTLTSNGAVTMSGIVNVSGTTAIQTGTLDLTGTLATPVLNISSGATLIQNGNIGPGSPSAAVTVVTNEGSLIVDRSAVFKTYVSNGGLLDIRNGRMITQTIQLNDGSITRGGTYSADLITTHGAVRIENNALSGQTIVASGVLDLEGSLGTNNVEIAGGATLLNRNGGLRNTATVTNAGSLVLLNSDQIATYTSNGGLLDVQSGTLTTNQMFLNDGSVTRGSASANQLVTNGDVRIEGGIIGNSANVASGVLTLTGTLGLTNTSIASGATLRNLGGDFTHTISLTNVGTIDLQSDASVRDYISNGGTLIAGPGTLFASNAELGNGSSIAGLLNAGTLNSMGAVGVTGTITAGTATLQGGTLTLEGSLISDSVTIQGRSQLVNVNGGLQPTATVDNRGSLLLLADDTITSYISNGGSLEPGTHWLTVEDAVLNDGSLVRGRLRSTTLDSDGAVLVEGRIESALIDIRGGVLTNTGFLDASSGRLNLGAGATLIADGTQQYSLLTTSGADPGTWQGVLTNPGTVAPGGIGGVGVLAVTSDFTNLPGGTLHLDLDGGGSDLLVVGGTATFGGDLHLRQLGALPVFTTIQVVDAAQYAGSFSGFLSDATNPLWFNPTDGTVMALPDPGRSGGLWGGTANQTAIMISLYDDVIDPGVTNITGNPDGSYTVLGGLADGNNPGMLNALTASFAPGGLNAAVVNRLSPEPYAGFIDYASHATLSLARAVRASLAGRAAQASPDASSPGARRMLVGSKATVKPPPAAMPANLFLATDFFFAGTDGSPNQADYDLRGATFALGCMGSLNDRIGLGGYLGVNTGSIDGPLIDADASGWMAGLIGTALIHPPSDTTIGAGLSYGRFDFRGTRNGVQAFAGGWTPAAIDFGDPSGDSLLAHLDVTCTLWKNDRLRVSPTLALYSIWSDRNAIRESYAGPAGPPALSVDSENHNSSFVDLQLAAEYDPGGDLVARFLVGGTLELDNSTRRFNARFVNGARPFSVTAPGLDSDAWFLGAGLSWRPQGGDATFGLNVRADFPNDADPAQSVSGFVRFEF